LGRRRLLGVPRWLIRRFVGLAGLRLGLLLLEEGSDPDNRRGAEDFERGAARDP
jgi:hypothetical protein